MSASEYRGTVATVRRALERTFVEEDPRDAAWRGKVGPERISVRVDVVDDPNGGSQPMVVSTAEVLPIPRLTGPLARAILLEHDGFPIGRLRQAKGALVAEEAILGGATLHQDEISVAVWTVGWLAGSMGERIHLRIGDLEPGPLEQPEVDVRRGAEERVAAVRERVERVLSERGFVDDPDWGLHGASGSSRVFVSVQHHLERSTAVGVACPVLIDVDLSDELALDAMAIADDTAIGRFAYTEARRELWFEHTILGDDLQEVELLRACEAVAEVADRQDERLATTYGGRRYLDLAL
jgi:hypothetical protein